MSPLEKLIFAAKRANEVMLREAGIGVVDVVAIAEAEAALAQQAPAVPLWMQDLARDPEHAERMAQAGVDGRAAAAALAQQAPAVASTVAEDDPEAPPWLLTGDAATLIANTHRVRVGAVQAAAKAAYRVFEQRATQQAPAAEPVAHCELTPNRQIAYFDGKPMVMVGPVGNECHPHPLYLAPQPPQAPKPAGDPPADDDPWAGDDMMGASG